MRKGLWLLVLLVMFLSILIRLVPLKNYHSKETIYNGRYLQTTHDAYLFTLQAYEIENGPVVHDKRVAGGIGYLCYFLKKILRAKIDNVAFFSPVVFSSFVVIPIFIIGCLLGSPFIGLVASLFTIFSQGYFLRTRIGYFDTDMLNLFFPVMTIALLLLFLKEKDRGRRLWIVFLCALNSQLYYFWYLTGITINFFTFLVFFLYLLTFKRSKELYFEFLLLFVLSSKNVNNLLFSADRASFLFLLLELLLVFIFYILLKKKSVKNYYNYLFVFFFIIIHLLERELFVYQSVLSKFGFYLLHKKKFVVKELAFPSVSRSISEVRGLSFEGFSKLLCNNVYVTLFSIAATIYMFFKKRESLLLVPFFFLGLLAMRSNRLVIYAPVSLGLGLGYFIQNLPLRFLKGRFYKVFAILLVVLIISPSISLVPKYKFRPVLNSYHVAGLDKLRNIAKRSDLGWTWWDYGYITQYFSLIKTYADGGNHEGNVIYPIALTLVSNNPTLASNIMLLCSEKGPGEVVFENYTNKTIGAYIKELSEKKLDLEKTRDVYFILFDDIVKIFGWIYYFGTWDFVRQDGRRGFYFVSRCREARKAGIFVMSKGFIVDTNRGFVIFGPRALKLHKVLLIYGKKYQEKDLFRDGICFIYLPHLDIGVLMEKGIYYSNFFQMLFTNRYRKDLFELVYDDYPRMRIYRLR